MQSIRRSCEPQEAMIRSKRCFVAICIIALDLPEAHWHKVVRTLMIWLICPYIQGFPVWGYYTSTMMTCSLRKPTQKSIGRSVFGVNTKTVTNYAPSSLRTQCLPPDRYLHSQTHVPFDLLCMGAQNTCLVLPNDISNPCLATLVRYKRPFSMN